MVRVKFIISSPFKSYRTTYRALYLHFQNCWIARKIPVTRRIKMITSVFHKYAHFPSISTLVHSTCTLNALETHFFAHFYHLKGNSEETQRTPAQVILIKLGQMAEGKNDSDWFTISDFGFLEFDWSIFGFLEFDWYIFGF